MHFSRALPFLSLAIHPLVQAFPSATENLIPSLDILPRNQFFDCDGKSVAMIEAVGSGGFGTVYRGTLREEGEDDREVAIKQFHRRETKDDPLSGYAIAAERFTEDKTQVMQIYATCKVRGKEYVVSEWLEGNDIEKLIGDGTLKDDGNLRFAIDQWLAGLASIHYVGVAHGDVKPDNAMCGADMDWCKVVDYDSLMTEKEKRTACGTRAYMSPEALMLGEFGSFKTRQNDVWSAGVAIMKMVTNKAPWTDAGSPKALEVWQNEDPADRATHLYSKYYISKELAEALSHVFAPQDQRMHIETLRSLIKKAPKLRRGWWGRRAIFAPRAADDDLEPILDTDVTICTFAPGNGTSSGNGMHRM